MLAVGLSNGKLYIYDDHEPFCLRDKYASHRGRIDSLAWSNDGKSIATVSSERIVYVWDALTLDLVVPIEISVDRIISIAWSPEDNFINAVSVLGTYPTANLSIQSYCVNTSEKLSSCSEEYWNTSWPAVSQDNKFLALASPDGNVQVWDTSTISLVAIV
ncbi:MAG: WD40 repeat domain-containing protein [Leptolyngbyaceae cyanobacterium SL_5_14]|nr:WD40 repeat domain-containing protein [Leptolyngbyaceae cyanobacterium SL_5_14]